MCRQGKKGQGGGNLGTETRLLRNQADVRSERKENESARDRLVKKAMRGNKNALHELCQSITKEVLFSTTSILGNRTDAEDATQEVLIRVYTNIKSLKDFRAFNAWLGRITINEARRVITKNSKHSNVLNISDFMSLVEEENEEYLPQEHTLREEERTAVIAVVDRLPYRQKEAVLLHYFSGLNVTEVAEAMDIAQQTASDYLKLAREKVRVRLLETPSTQKLRARRMAFAPIGLLLAQALQQEAAQFSLLHEAWAASAVESCIAAVKGGTLATASATSSSSGASSASGTLGASGTSGTSGSSGASGASTAQGTSGASTAQGSSATSVAGSSFGGVGSVIAAAVTTTAVALSIYLGAMAYQGTNAEPVLTDYVIALSGGYSASSQINPRSAVASASTQYGELIAVSWQITPVGSDEVLYSGEGASISTELIQLQEDGAYGDYVIGFLMEDESGNSYWMSRQITIMDLPD